ncbi:MAG: c-type cytochrome [Lysobacteraceae bacterium]
MSLKSTLGVSALLIMSVAIAQTPAPTTAPSASPTRPAQPVGTSQSSPAPSAQIPKANAPGNAQVTPLPETAPAPMIDLTDAHARAKPGDAKVGQTKAGVCAACHGLDGNSADPQNPKLAAQHERYIARQLALFKTGERQNAIMVSFASALSPQDMRDVGAYFETQKVVPGVADDTKVKSGSYQGKKFYQVGEMLYRGGDATRNIPACMACHGPAGAGNPGPAYPNVSGQHASYVAAQLTAFRGGAIWGQKDYANVVMSQVAHNLTDEEIQALATYLEGLHPASADAAAGSAATGASH